MKLFSALLPFMQHHTSEKDLLEIIKNGVKVNGKEVNDPDLEVQEGDKFSYGFISYTIYDMGNASNREILEYEECPTCGGKGKVAKV